MSELIAGFLTESWMREGKESALGNVTHSFFAAGIVTACRQQYTVKLLAKAVSLTCHYVTKKFFQEIKHK